jgi:hypothetical protein|tara:strand:+ start:26 stop:265 length:240 start_codon:yes stop_codon:yes gene_type:complete
MESGLRFIDRKQEEHKEELGVYADTCHKLGEWCEEYAKQYHQEQVTLGLPSVMCSCKEKQRQNIIDIMKADEESGMYED